MLEKLQELGNENSSENRREVLGAVADLFLHGADNHENMDVALFSDVMLQLLGGSNVHARAEFSEKIASCDLTPHDVAKSLALDEISVAEPVLQKSSLLSDEDLVEVALNQTQDHLLAISKRETINEAVTNVLVNRGETEVIRQVSSNAGAKFSEMGFVKLADHANTDQVVGQNLTNREDITEEIAELIIPSLPPELGNRIKHAIENKQASILKSEIGNRRLAARKDRVAALVLADEIKNGSRELNECLMELVNSDRFVDLTILLAKLTDLPEKVVRNTFFNRKSEPIVLICKSLEANDDTFEAVATLWAKRMQHEPQKVRDAMMHYRKIDSETANRTLRFVILKNKVR